MTDPRRRRNASAVEVADEFDIVVCEGCHVVLVHRMKLPAASRGAVADVTSFAGGERLIDRRIGPRVVETDRNVGSR